MKNNLENILTVIGLIILVVILLGLPLQILWNWLMPDLFNLSYISFWQAVGLNLMAAILFRPTTTIKNKD
jgi:asparagine N-glycosylation enzyme membrane subunit Stt3